MVFYHSDEQKEEMVQTLLMVQPSCTEAYARQMLQKHNWDVDQAATALLDITSANELKSSRTASDVYGASGSLNAPNPPPARPNSVIDLTMDEEDIDLATGQAVEASLSSQPPAYGPANVMDKSNWALVPSNAPPVLTQEDRALNEALEASLTTSFVASQEPYEEPADLTERLRKTGFPVALRSTDSSLIHLPVVLQCLLNIPKIQERLRLYNPGTSPGDEADYLYKDLQRASACLALSVRSYIPVDSLFESSNEAFRVSKNHEPLAGSIREYYQYLARYLEKTPCDPSSLDYVRLLEFQGGTELEAEKGSNDYHIEVNVPTPYGNDLMSCLTHCFAKAGVFLSQLSECFAFLVCREEPVFLKYPSRIYMDRFLKDNIEEANRLMHYQEGVQHEIQKLQTDRHKISNWQNQDTLKAFRSTLYYFENLVNDNDDLTRRAKNDEVKSKLRSIIAEIEGNIQYLDTRIKDLTHDAENLFNTADFQNFPYDLNAVIMHDGLFGRNHLYSYTKDSNGTWWKILDYHVSEVSEDAVLNDQSGLHLSSGPILLLYTKPSKMDPNLVQDYPKDVLELIDYDNHTFVSNPSEIQSQYATPNETPAAEDM